MGHAEACAGESEERGQAQEDLTVEDVTVEGGAVEFQDRNVLVTGNVHRGAVIRGDGDVQIQGDVTGDPGGPCVVETSGRVVLERSAAFAKIRGREIVVKGDVEESDLSTELGAEISGDLSTTLVSLGVRSHEMRSLRQLRIEHRKIEQQLEERKGRIGSGARRFVRDYPQVDLEMGAVLGTQGRDLRVDLKPFYVAVRNRSPQEVDRALEEFYLRVVVGVLTRSNRHYISRNPSRHKVFLKLVEELRKHIHLVREADRLSDSLKLLSERRNVILEELKRPTRSTLFVGGAVGEDVVVRLHQFEGSAGDSDAGVDLVRWQAEARTVKGERGLGLQLRDLSGEDRTLATEGNGLHRGEFRLENGALAWRKTGPG